MATKDQLSIQYPSVAVTGLDVPRGLQEHDDRALAANGMSPDTGPANQKMLVGATIVAEAVTPTEAETIQTSQEERTQAFAFGLQNLINLIAHTAFRDRCKAEKIDEFDDKNPAYWKVLARFAGERVALYRGKLGDRLEFRILELMAATPAYYYTQKEIDDGKVNSKSHFSDNLSYISTYHGLISDTAERFPDLGARELTLTLLNSTNTTIYDDRERQACADLVRSRVRAIQREIAFGDILRQMGDPYRRATPLEDQQGFDYILNEGLPTQRKIDVKLSLHEIENRTDQVSPVALKNGVYLVYAMIRDRELHDSFHISDEDAKVKAKALENYLNNAAEHSSARTAEN